MDTSTLAEDTYTTFLTQLNGRRVVFEPAAVVLAEEPDTVTALWKQRVRWARGNVQITRTFQHVWFRPSRRHHLGRVDFGIIWFAIYLLPVAMTLAAVGLVGLYFVAEVTATQVFQGFWWVAVSAYVFITVSTLLLDRETARRSWFQGIVFPGLGAIVVMIAAWFPNLWEVRLPHLLGLEMTETGPHGLDPHAVLLVGARDGPGVGGQDPRAGRVRCGGSRCRCSTWWASVRCSARSRWTPT